MLADQHGDTATGKVVVTVDPGPTAGKAHLIIAPGQNIDLTEDLLALDRPGLAGEALALTGVATSGTRGTVSLSSGDLNYIAPTSGSTDVFTYAVSDENGDSATGSVGVSINPKLNTGTIISLTGSGNVVVGGNGNNIITGGIGKNWVNLGNGNDRVTLGSAAEMVNGGGGTALVQAATGTAGALINGSSGATTLEITNGGAATLNAATTDVTVRLDAATNLKLSKMGFVAAIGSAGNDTITAEAANQTLTGGAGADTLIGYSAFGDDFSDTSAGLNGDTITRFGGSDVIDLTDLTATKAKPLAYVGTKTFGVLTATDGTHTAKIHFAGSYTAANFQLDSDSLGGSLISFHP
jgi:Ca2+-binding RTX toxin-like protein